jgi:hypothetical protein
MVIKRHSFEEYTDGCLYHPRPGCVHLADEGRFISSLTGRRPYGHAPALDIDFPTTVETLDGGKTRVTIVGPKLTGETLRMVYLSMLQVRLMDDQDAPRILPEPTSDRLALPPLVLKVAAKAHPSSTPGHFHLFLEKEMTWSHYESLLIALRDAEVIGQDFAAMCLKWRVSFLLKPEHKKSDFKLKFATPA